MTYFKMNFHMALQNGEKTACIPQGDRQREIDCAGKINVFCFSSLSYALSMPNVETRMSRCLSSQALHVVPTTSIYILNDPLLYGPLLQSFHSS